MVDKDVLESEVGCVLLQKQPEGQDKPIGYWSESLTDVNARMMLLAGNVSLLFGPFYFSTHSVKAHDSL